MIPYPVVSRDELCPSDNIQLVSCGFVLEHSIAYCPNGFEGDAATRRSSAMFVVFPRSTPCRVFNDDDSALAATTIYNRALFSMSIVKV